MKTAYHFTGETLKDGRPIPPVGEWLEHEGDICICESGLHFSYDPFDALRYAPGHLLHLVEVDGIEAEQHDKGVCRRRRIIKTVDAEPLLREFARWCALQVIHLWNAPEVVKRYLETGDENIREAARDAASTAASAAAWSVRDAASTAASAAGDAARDAQRQKFNEMVQDALK